MNFKTVIKKSLSCPKRRLDHAVLNLSPYNDVYKKAALKKFVRKSRKDVFLTSNSLTSNSLTSSFLVPGPYAIYMKEPAVWEIVGLQNRNQDLFLKVFHPGIIPTIPQRVYPGTNLPEFMQVQGQSSGELTEVLPDQIYLLTLQQTQVVTLKPPLIEHKIYALHTDHLGSIVMVTNQKGEIEETLTYFPNGLIKDHYTNGDFTSAWLHTGQRLIAETIYYAHHRFRDLLTGRFISEDPYVRLTTTQHPFYSRLTHNHQEQNLYSYALNNPLYYIDPLGLEGFAYDLTTIKVNHSLNIKAFKTAYPIGGIDWINTKGGRSILDWPTNGNWGGKCWSGGQYSCGAAGMGNKPAIHSADGFYMVHDLGWNQVEKVTKYLQKNNLLSKNQIDRFIKINKSYHDQILVNNLKSLSSNSKEWPKPPKPGTEWGSEVYHKKAIWWFSK